MNIGQIEHLEKLLNSYKFILASEKHLKEHPESDLDAAALHKRKEDVTHLIHACFKNMFETEEADFKADKLGEYNGFICAQLRGIREAIEKLGRGDSLKITLPPTVTTT